MRCPNCQFDNRANAKFCIECGEKLELSCPQCGNASGHFAKFCDECGFDFGKADRPLYIDYSQPRTYTPKHLADKIITARPTVQGERKQVTVLFADVAGFTSISEDMDPEEVHDLMRQCLIFMTEEIHHYEGTIAQFLGDGVMALFGAPIAHEDAPQRALYAAIAIQERLISYADRLREKGISFNVRIGLNTGPVVVGRIGDDLTMEYTAIGDTVNLASRMESMAKPGTVQVAENTYRLTREYFEFRPLGEVVVKGKRTPVMTYQVLRAGLVRDRLGAAITRGLTRFVGRRQELDRLSDCFALVRKGQPQVVAIMGEAGVGKSRLLLEWRATRPAGEYTYLEGSCLHYGDAMAYLPMLNVLRSYLHIREGEQEHSIKQKMEERIFQVEKELLNILPPLYDLLSLKLDDEEYLRLGPPQKKERIIGALKQLLVREGQNKPLVIVIEDLHWIDNASEEFLSYLIESLANTQMLLVLLYRPEYVHPWSNRASYTQIVLDQLPSDHTSELVQVVLGEAEITPPLKELVMNKAGGNPLYIEELIHNLMENGFIRKSNNHYMLSREITDIQVPDTVEGIIAARIDRLAENLKQKLQLASVIGRSFAFRILQTILETADDLKSNLDDLQARGFIQTASPYLESEYIFRHALIQEVAYNSLLRKTKRVIHEKIGKAIEEIYPDRLEEFYETLAHHYFSGERLDKAYQYMKLSAEKAARSYSNWESYRFYKQALDALNMEQETDENKRRGIEVRLSMSIPMSWLGCPEDSLRVLQDGEKLSKELGDRRGVVTFHSIMGLCLTLRGDTLQGIEYAENIFREAEEAQDTELMAQAGFDLCTAYYAAGEFFKLVEVAARVITRLEQTHRESASFSKGFNTYSALLAIRGAAMGYLGNFKEGQALCEKGLRFALETDDPYSLTMIELHYGLLFSVKGDAGNAVKHFENGITYSEKTQLLVLSGILWASSGFGHLLLGNLETARNHAEKALRIQIEGIPFKLSLSYWLQAMVDLESDNLKSARRYIEKALELSQRHNERDQEAISKISLGRILGREGKSQRHEAEEYILQGMKELGELNLKPWIAHGYLALAELCANAGQLIKARKYLGKGRRMFREMGMDYWLDRTQMRTYALKSLIDKAFKKLR